MNIKVVAFSLLFGLSLSVATKAEASLATPDTQKVTVSAYPKQTGSDSWELLLRLDIRPEWHIQADPAGDVGTPTRVTFDSVEGRNVRLLDVSTPKRFIYEDILGQYGYDQTMWFLFAGSDSEQSRQEPVSFNVSWTACRDECFPESVNLTVHPQNAPSANLTKPLYQMAMRTFPIDVVADTRMVTEENDFIISYRINQPIVGKPLYFIYGRDGLFSPAQPQTLDLEDDRTVRIRVSGVADAIPEKTFGGILITDRVALRLHPLAGSSDPFWPWILSAFLAGLILNLMPCVFPILSLKALSLTHSGKSAHAVRHGLLYMGGVITSFAGTALLIDLLKKGGEQLGWGFQLQSPVFVGGMLGIFCLIFLLMIGAIPLKVFASDLWTRLSSINSFLTGFFAVIIATPCTGPLMGAVVGYAFMQPPERYFPIFLTLGFGYALPFTLLEMFPNVIAKHLPKSGKWLTKTRYILALPVFLTCLWLGWVLYHQLTTVQTAISGLWKPYNRAQIERQLQKNRPVFIDFTAKWCLTCLMNEKTSLSTPAFEKYAKEHNMYLVRADWTNRDSKITDALSAYGRRGVPLYVFYPAGNQDTPLILPQILTPHTLLKYLETSRILTNDQPHG